MGGKKKREKGAGDQEKEATPERAPPPLPSAAPPPQPAAAETPPEPVVAAAVEPEAEKKRRRRRGKGKGAGEHEAETIPVAELPMAAAAEPVAQPPPTQVSAAPPATEPEFMEAKKKTRGRGRAVSTSLGRGDSISELIEKVGLLHVTERPTPPPGMPQQRPTPPPPKQSSYPSAGTGYEPPRYRTKPGWQLGKDGKPITLEVNYFDLQIKGENIYHYDVQMEPERPKFLLRTVIEKVRETCPAFKGYWPVFDGVKNLYTARPLPQRTIEAKVAVCKEDRTLEFKVTINFVSQVEVTPALQYCKKQNTRATSSDIPQTAVQALDIVLMHAPALGYVKVGRKFFTEPDRVMDIGGGNEVWFGHYQSIRLIGWKPMINIDTANKAFHSSISVLEKLCQLTRQRPEYLHGGLQYKDLEKFKEAIKGLKIVYQPGDGSKRSYRVTNVLDPPNKLKFDLDGTPTTVLDYMKLKNIKVSYPNLPCLHVGSIEKTIYLPAELCTIEAKQANNKKLTDDQTANMIRFTATDAITRKAKILNSKQKAGVGKDPFCREFGISVSDSMARVQGRVLAPPVLAYGTDEKQYVTPRDGVWQMRGTQFIVGQKMEKWAVINLDYRMKPHILMQFISDLQKKASEVGLQILKPLDIKTVQEREIPKALHSYRGFQLVMVILAGMRGNVYANVKRVGDMEVKITTQCIQSKNVDNPKPATLSNICLKLNSKLGGVNNAIRREVRPQVFTQPVLVMGADVTHPSPDQKKIKPSIAAIVGSTDPAVDPRKYELEIRVQDAAQDVEIILDMQNVTRNLLEKFYQKTKLKPKKIIMFRDGVSEGQFYEVLKTEVTAIRNACQSLEVGYRPGLTYIVVQKRHHTRLFPTRKEDELGRGRNVPPGTIIDVGINHPTEFDYFLCSHQGIQGTSRPCHYHLLWDDNNFTADELEKMSYYLCHTYVRCTRSVSYPAPTYYAHLAAYRGRMHHNSLLEKDERHKEKDIQNLEGLNSMYFV